MEKLDDLIMSYICYESQSVSHLVMSDSMWPGSSVHGILQARTLEWVAIAFSRGSSQPRDWTWVFHIAGRFWATREAHACHTFAIDRTKVQAPTLILLTKS